jgi:ATP-dependent exoDNAse (exonuclease V) alpha subunit
VSTQVRERVSRIEARSTRITRIPLGLNAGEAIAALLAIALLVWLVVAYFTSLRPQQERLRALETELAEQQRSILAGSTPSGGDQPSPSDQARDAIESLETFKTGHLKHFSSGRIDLIKEINALAKKNNVALTSGIDMTANVVESGDANKLNGKTDKKGASTRKKADEVLNSFPSVNFRFTVFGPYANLRTFINEIEREKQFLVINSINLTNQEAKISSRRSRGEGTSGIMLNIEMSAYFQPM